MIAAVAADESHAVDVLVRDDALSVVLLLVDPPVAMERLADERGCIGAIARTRLADTLVTLHPPSCPLDYRALRSRQPEGSMERRDFVTGFAAMLAVGGGVASAQQQHRVPRSE